jgi:hypothetical protein
MIYKVFNASLSKTNKLRKACCKQGECSLTNNKRHTVVIAKDLYNSCGFHQFGCLSLCWNRDKYTL